MSLFNVEMLLQIDEIIDAGDQLVLYTCELACAPPVSSLPSTVALINFPNFSMQVIAFFLLKYDHRLIC